MSTYYMKNTGEAVDYCKDIRKSVSIGTEYKYGRDYYRIDMYTSDEPTYTDGNHIDGVLANKTTIKGFLRRTLGLSRQELDSKLWQMYRGAVQEYVQFKQPFEHVFISEEAVKMISRC